jgi:hypothetical protein
MLIVVLMLCAIVSAEESSDKGIFDIRKSGKSRLALNNSNVVRDTLFKKVKIKLMSDGVIYLKAILHDVKVNEEDAKKLNIEPYYITNITAKIGKKVLFDATTSSALYKTQVIEFYFEDAPSENNVTFSVTDNRGYMTHHSFKIIRKQKHLQEVKLSETQVSSLETQTIDYGKTHSKVWEATTIDEATKLLYGTTDVIDIKNKAYSLTDNLVGKEGIVIDGKNPIQFKIFSDKRLESIAILITGKKHVVTAVVHIHKGYSVGINIEQRNCRDKVPSKGILYFKFPSIESEASEAIVLLAKSTDGKVYKFQPIKTKIGYLEENSYSPISLKL